MIGAGNPQILRATGGSLRRAAGRPGHLEQVAERPRVRVVVPPDVDQLAGPGLAGEAALLQDDADALAQFGGLRGRVETGAAR
jgi:hypothetical protein